MNDNRRMVSRLAAFVIWAAIAASIVFWSMRLWVKPMAVPEHATLVSTVSGFNGDLSRLFGADTPAAQALSPGVEAATTDARFKLIGVVAPRSAGAMAEGLALIATDGKPAKAYRVGTAVDGELVLQAVHARGASLGSNGQSAQVRLELPALPPPNTGAPVSAAGAAAAKPAPMRALPSVRPAPAEPPVEQPAMTPQYAPASGAEESAPPQRPMGEPPSGAESPQPPS